MSGSGPESNIPPAKHAESTSNDSPVNGNVICPDDNNQALPKPNQQVGSKDEPSRLEDRRHEDSNTPNLPEYTEVSTRLYQIRDYISQTTIVMEQLRAAGTPKHIEQWVKLADMLEGLRDSEMKLSTILHTLNRIEEEKTNPAPKTNAAPANRNELKMKIDESEKKLSELKEQQAALISLKQKARDQLKKGQSVQPIEMPSSGVSTERTLEITKLQNRLKELQMKNAQMDQLVAQFSSLEQTTENNGDVSRNGFDDGDDDPPSTGIDSIDDKIAELAALKLQLHRMQTLMAGLPVRSNSQEPNVEVNAVGFRSHEEKLDNYSEASTQQSSDSGTIVVNQLQAKSMKLQEARAKLHHLQGLLSLVEECRDSGKPVPEKVLTLLSSSGGPINDEDSDTLLDLPAQSLRDMYQEVRAEVIAVDAQKQTNGETSTVNSSRPKRQKSEE